MRLNEAAIQAAPQVTNPLDERELDLRGIGLQKMDETVLSKIAEDFDTINLIDNQLTVLDAFPRMERLGTLLLHKNPTLASVHGGVPLRTPNLHSFIANECGFASLAQLNFLAGWGKTLQRVSFTKCPLYDKVQHAVFEASNSFTGTASPAVAVPQSLRNLSAEAIIRLYIIAICSTALTSPKQTIPLKLIDFNRVLDVERQQAKLLKDDLFAFARSMTSGASASASTVASPAPEGAPDGTKIRKRARAPQAVVAQADSDNASFVGAGPTAAVAAIAADDSLFDPLEAITEEELKRREAALEERMQTAETEEDIAAIEIEIEKLDQLRRDFAAGQAAPKRARTERS